MAAGVAGDDELEGSDNAQQCAALSQVKVARTSPVARSHTFTVLSEDAETARCPSGVTATALTHPCGRRGCVARARWPAPTPSASRPQTPRPPVVRPGVTATASTHVSGQ